MRVSGADGQSAGEAAGGRRARVFLSYSRKDLAFAEELIISLESHGFEMVVDREDLFPGEQWAPRLQHFISEADTTVCIVSANWAASPQCTQELDIALERGRRVLPLIIDQIAPSSLPEAIARLQFVFFIGQGRSFARGVADLVAALRTDIDWLRDQTRLLDRAQEWDATQRSAALLLRGAALERALQWLEAPRPEHTRVLPLVAEFVAASQRGQSDEERKRLRGRVRTVGLAGLAAVGLLTSGLLYLNNANRVLTTETGELRTDLEVTQTLAANEEEETLNASSGGGASGAVDDLRSDSQTSTEQPPRVVASGVVGRLIASNARERIAAGQEIVDAIRGGRSDALMGDMVALLEVEQLQQLSASARFNVLYMLNVYDAWPDSPHAADLRAALTLMETRAGEGVRVGAQTQDCIDKLRRKLDGAREVGNRCGGR